jgi:hypothetical protein
VLAARILGRSEGRLGFMDRIYEGEYLLARFILDCSFRRGALSLPGRVTQSILELEQNASEDSVLIIRPTAYIRSTIF